MNIRDLEYVVALHHHKNFGRAADACFVSQPTLSAQFKKLEQELGVYILDRSTKGVVYTDVGLEILEKAKSILQHSEDIRDISKYFHDPEAGLLKIGVIPTVGPYLLPYITKGIRAAFLRLNLQFSDRTTSQIVEKLQAGDIDLGILALPLDEDKLEEFPLYDENFYLALSSSHQKSKERSVQSEWLKDETIFLLEEGHCFGNQALQLCSRYEGQAASFRGTSLETLRAMVQFDEGVTLVPELTKKMWEEQESQLVYLPFPKPSPTRRIGLIFRKGAMRAELCRKVGEKIKKELKTILPKNRSKTSETLSVF